ncbi:MAG: hypothetical protein HY735_02630 [Verrucomicrobia bacterium]|nr:hypothetical protein [Verrucomicrobiota bacterium]
MRIDGPFPTAAKERFGPRSPARRIVFAFAWVALIALLPARLWIWQLPSAFALIFVTRKLGVSFTALGKRTLLIWPFVGFTALGLLGQPEWHLRVGNLVLKAVLSIWILSLLTQTTSVIELIAGLRRLHFPAIWVELFAFLVRYASVLATEWNRMQLAREARTFHLPSRERWRLLAQSLGCLFIRAYERAERIHQAMLARGYR